MKRFMLTLLAAGLVLTTTAQISTQHRLFKSRKSTPELQNFYQLYERANQQARSAKIHDSLSISVWDNGQWSDTQHSKITRNAQQQIVEVINYDPTTASLQAVSKFEMIYSQNKLQRQIMSSMDSAGWRKEMMLEHRFDSYENKTSTTFSVWDQNGLLQLFYGDSLAYSYRNQEIVSVAYSISFGFGPVVMWSPFIFIDDIKYDSAKKPSSFTQFEFDNQLQRWSSPVFISKLAWGFGFKHWHELFMSDLPLVEGLEPFVQSPRQIIDPTDYLISDAARIPLHAAVSNKQHAMVSQITYSTYHATQGWKIEEETRFDYNAQNKITNIVQSTFDEQSGQFEDQYRDVYHYQQGYFTGNTFEIFLNNQWIMQNGRDFIYSFDTDGRVTEILARNYDQLASSWLNSDKFSYHYPSQTTSVGRLAMNDVKVFPNPTQGNIDIQMMSNKSIDRIVVRNLQGQALYTADFSFQNTSEHSLDLGHLPAGMYFVQIQSGRETGVARVVKR